MVTWIGIAAVSWIALAVLVSVLVGGGVRIADRQSRSTTRRARIASRPVGRTIAEPVVAATALGSRRAA